MTCPRRAHRCLVTTSRSSYPEARLFLLPHAGGAASSFRDWRTAFPHTIELCPVQLAGRESRFKEKPHRRIEPLVEELAQAIAPLTDRPYALFGHSLGAIVAFELALRLGRETGHDPVLLCVSGRAAPQLIRAPERPLHRLSDRELIDELRRLGGSPREVLENEDLLAVVLPIIRADLELLETWVPHSDARVGCHVLAFRGRDDTRVDNAGLEAWRDATAGPFESLQLAGGHFYQSSSRRVLIETTRNRLGQALGRERRARELAEQEP